MQKGKVPTRKMFSKSSAALVIIDDDSEAKVALTIIDSDNFSSFIASTSCFKVALTIIDSDSEAKPIPLNRLI